MMAYSCTNCPKHITQNGVHFISELCFAILSGILRYFNVYETKYFLFSEHPFGVATGYIQSVTRCGSQRRHVVVTQRKQM